MKLMGIQSRILLAAVLPATLVATLLAIVFLILRVGDNQESHQQLARSQIRQVASASEFGVFSGNVESLKAIANGALKQANARFIVIFDAKGRELIRAGRAVYPDLPSLVVQSEESVTSSLETDLFTQPIVAGVLKLDDSLESSHNSSATAPQLMGQVVMEFSRESLVRRRQDMVLLGVAVTGVGLLFSVLLGVMLGRGVIRPILRVSHMIVEIGRGSLSIREVVEPNDPLRDIQIGLNQMAAQLEASHDEMSNRIEVATAELREKKEEAELATLAKSQFLAAASHDLRQPTHALGMFVARLSQIPHDDQTRYLVMNLEASVHALQDLLDGLLDISKLDAGAVKINRRAVSVNSLFDQVRRAMVGQANDKDLRLRFRATSLWVYTDPVLMQRILLNLVSNAVRYTAQGSVLVTCRTCAGQSKARIDVWDSGIGIAPEHQQLIFKEFFQVGNQERDRNKGMGLGLNIVKRTADLLGQTLSVRSNLGKGSRFTVDAPIAAADWVISEMTDQGDMVIPGLQGARVLVIEDDELARRAMSGLLESWGCVVAVADDTSSALRSVFVLGTPDVIISDYRLRGGESGLAVIAALRTLVGYEMVACLASGNTDQELIRQAQDLALTVLHKPVRPAKLRSLMNSLLAQARAQNLERSRGLGA